jgi:uncharacterized protein (DUF2236 family)
VSWVASPPPLRSPAESGKGLPYHRITTREPILPSKDEAAGLIPRRGGVTWRIAGDARLLAASGYSLLMQVTHPSVGAGVSQHSNFKEDPWGRLLRTLDYTSSVVYGGPELAWEAGRRVREMHRRIQGIRPDGVRYAALEPAPWAWVHATLAEAIVRGHRLFCSPALSPIEIGEFWSEWQRLGRLIGVRDEDLPESWDGLLAYFDEMVEQELSDTEAARDVLAALRDPGAPPLPWMRETAWRLVRWPWASAGFLATRGMLPPELRERLGVDWSASAQRRFSALAGLARASRPLMPPQARSFGPSYLRWRRRHAGLVVIAQTATR